MASGVDRGFIVNHGDDSTTLAGSHMLLRADLIPGAIVALRPDGTVTDLNATARRVFAEQAVVGRSWLELWPSVAHDAWAALTEAGRPLRHEGEVGPLAFSFTLVRDRERDTLLAYGADVTELKRAEETLAEQAGELRENALFPEMNPGPVCRLDLDGTILRANRKSRELWGDDLIGKAWREFVPVMTDEGWVEIVETGVRSWTEAQIGERWFGFTLARAPDSQYVYAYGADVTLLKNAERTLEQMALFPEMNPGPVLRLDREGHILLANRAARALVDASELVGRDWTEICPGIDRALLARVLEGGQTIRHEVELAGRSMLFTHTPGFDGHQVFVYGADLTDLKQAEQALRQSERMATLGTLAAGVAHELNNPSAAVQRAAEHLANVMRDLQVAQLALSRLALEDETLERLAELDAQARLRATSPPDFDPVTRSDHEYDVELWLEDQAIDEGWDLAPSLVGLGYRPPELDDLAAALPAEHLAPVVTWMSRTYPVYSVLEEIRHGSFRLSEIVSALKAYSYVDQAPVQAVDVNEGLRHTLIILQSKLKRGVTVQLELDPELPRIEAYGGDLNQVWTNLIDNAVDAMGGEGRLVLRSVAEGAGVRVEVEDDGPGIPSDIQGRIFDPFFTTKPQGQGTGLGLHTTYTVVSQKHGGKIELSSEPGRTCFVVRLPLELPAAQPQGASADGVDAR